MWRKHVFRCGLYNFRRIYVVHSSNCQKHFRQQVVQLKALMMSQFEMLTSAMENKLASARSARSGSEPVLNFNFCWSIIYSQTDWILYVLTENCIKLASKSQYLFVCQNRLPVMSGPRYRIFSTWPAPTLLTSAMRPPLHPRWTSSNLTSHRFLMNLYATASRTIWWAKFTNLAMDSQTCDKFKFSFSKRFQI